MKKLFLLLVLLAAACAPGAKEEPNKKEAPQQETAVSTNSILNAPANYLRTTTQAIGQAKEAKALMEKTQQERLDAASGQ